MIDSMSSNRTLRTILLDLLPNPRQTIRARNDIKRQHFSNLEQLRQNQPLDAGYNPEYVKSLGIIAESKHHEAVGKITSGTPVTSYRMSGRIIGKYTINNNGIDETENLIELAIFRIRVANVVSYLIWIATLLVILIIIIVATMGLLDNILSVIYSPKLSVV